MKTKIFTLQPLTSDRDLGVFAYDFLPSIKRQMICDEYGFYHSQGNKIQLDKQAIKSTHYVQGWNLGNGNILSENGKIVECIDFYDKESRTYYVAYTRSSQINDKESCAIYMYRIIIDEVTERILLDSELNIFEFCESQLIFDKGISGNLSFAETLHGVSLKWLNKSCSSSTNPISYSYDICSAEIQTLAIETLDSCNCINKIIRENTFPHLHFHKVSDNKDLYVCVIDPTLKKANSPAIVVCLGGPNIPIPDFSDKNSIYEQFRRNGFFVIVPLRRGIIGVSQEWADGITNEAGIIDTDDILVGADYALKEYSDQIDCHNVGIYGASYGGFSCLLIAGKHNNSKKFKAVVSHCGMSDLEHYPYECYGNSSDVMQYYAGKEDFLSKVKSISPYNFVQNWNVPILLVHTIDDTSVWFGQSVRIYNRGTDCDKIVNLILALGPHSYGIPNGKHLVNMIIKFFVDNLIF